VNATNLLDTHQDIGGNSGPSFDLEKYLRMAQILLENSYLPGQLEQRMTEFVDYYNLRR
jgi:hypothetical protein